MADGTTHEVESITFDRQTAFDIALHVRFKRAPTNAPASANHSWEVFAAAASVSHLIIRCNGLQLLRRQLYLPAHAAGRREKDAPSETALNVTAACDGVGFIAKITLVKKQARRWWPVPLCSSAPCTSNTYDMRAPRVATHAHAAL